MGHRDQRLGEGSAECGGSSKGCMKHRGREWGRRKKGWSSEQGPYQERLAEEFRLLSVGRDIDIVSPFPF